jgi:hypothetical protein
MIDDAHNNIVRFDSAKQDKLAAELNAFWTELGAVLDIETPEIGDGPRVERDAAERFKVRAVNAVIAKYKHLSKLCHDDQYEEHIAMKMKARGWMNLNPDDYDDDGEPI